jgi:PHP family Zn ribbon phosphoesterase
MHPDRIVRRAQDLGVNLIAVTDHNSAENAAATLFAAEGTDVTVLPGMEVQTREEAHVICLFDTLEQVGSWQEEVYASLPALENDEDVLGMQVVLDASGAVSGRNERLLLTSTSLSVDEVVERVRDRGGLCIPAHVDRPAYSIISNLGFIPPALDIAGAEISPNVGLQEARDRFPELAHFGLVAGGDAHRLREIGRRTTFKMAEATVAEIAMALVGQGDRGVWVDGFRSVKVT